ncbi:hypothetical protein L207DRAFT_506085 [Hyaloscypha variabilis F]|uniref:Fungal N-terminal domain-containing protein n=1 Tax=Hyaloscypha variabilis (strain UAMH 11265 / GT02V1 / F) TaxID=1149755 RepID=A0A2J6S8D5_HYAVF|nr:hypothetical protein L207DRAFT_506085 [Hyaloscypha variabilis F]
MSFGYSVGDCILLLQLARTQYKNCVAAGDEYNEIAREVKSLYSILKILKDEAEKPESPLLRNDTKSTQELVSATEGCKYILEDLQTLLAKYEGLLADGEAVSGTRKLWHKIRFGSKIQWLGDFRAKIITYTSTISVLLDAMQLNATGRLEDKVDAGFANMMDNFISMKKAILDEVIKARSQQRGRSTVSLLSLSTYNEDDKEVWREFRRELIAKGFNSRKLDHHKDVLKSYILKLEQCGVLDQLKLPANENAPWWTKHAFLKTTDTLLGPGMQPIQESSMETSQAIDRMNLTIETFPHFNRTAVNSEIIDGPQGPINNSIRTFGKDPSGAAGTPTASYPKPFSILGVPALKTLPEDTSKSIRQKQEGLHLSAENQPSETDSRNDDHPTLESLPSADQSTAPSIQQQGYDRSIRIWLRATGEGAAAEESPRRGHELTKKWKETAIRVKEPLNMDKVMLKSLPSAGKSGTGEYEENEEAATSQRSRTIDYKEDGTGINFVHGEVAENLATAEPGLVDSTPETNSSKKARYIMGYPAKQSSSLSERIEDPSESSDVGEDNYSKSKKSSSSRLAYSESRAGSKSEDKRRQPNVDQIILDTPANTSSNHRSLERPQTINDKDSYDSEVSSYTDSCTQTSASSDEEGRPKRRRRQRPRMEAASLDTVAKPASPKMMLASSNTSIRRVDNEETWENTHEGRQGRNRSQRDIATNFEMLPLELEVTRGRFMAIGARNRYFEEIFVPGEKQPQKRCRSCGWTSSSPRWEPRQSQAILEAFL